MRGCEFVYVYIDRSLCRVRWVSFPYESYKYVVFVFQGIFLESQIADADRPLQGGPGADRPANETVHALLGEAQGRNREIVEPNLQ